jgi:diguanylate cyclase (GGDEF)-like protein
VLVLANQAGGGAFTAARLDAVTLITGQLIVSLRNALLYGSLEQRVADRTAALATANRQLEELSGTDSLTELPNRRRFRYVLDAEWDRAMRTAGSLAVVMIDVDHFKLFNDHYGHLAGDDCLRRVAGALGDSTRRTTDLACRYGGEEFVIVLAGSDAAGAAVVAERARAAVAALALPHALSDPGVVTVSVGVAAALVTQSMVPDDLVARADAALYQAKRDGRNRIAVND